MAVKSPGIRLNPGVLRWARETAGVSLQDLARRLNPGEETIAKWETGEKTVTVRTLRDVARFLKRPLAVFLLPEPPPELPVPPDFRTLPKDSLAPLSKKTRLVIRRALRL